MVVGLDEGDAQIGYDGGDLQLQVLAEVASALKGS